MRQVPHDQVLARARNDNPWWDSPHGLPNLYARWKPRPYLDLFFPLIRSSRVRRAVVLMGPRRVGKTVLIHHAIQRLLLSGVPPARIAYFAVDHPLYNGMSLEELVAVAGDATGADFAGGELFVFFDEIQYLRDWEIHLKRLVDDYPALRVAASGSAAAALKLKSDESGAGRFTDFLLPPLTFYEYLCLLDADHIVQPTAEQRRFHSDDLTALNERFVHYLSFGGYPEVVLTPEIQADPARFVKADIIDKVLLRDLPSLYGIQDIQELNSLFTTLAYNTAGELSLEELSKSSGVAKNTIKRYIEYLEAAFLIRVVHRVDQAGRRFRRARFFKVYLTNPSLRAALFSPIADGDPAIGPLVETAVFAQWFHSEHQLYYARWDRGEIDMVSMQGNNPRWAVEVKWSDRLADRPVELADALRFCRKHEIELAVTSRTTRKVEEIDGVRVHFWPAAELCYTVGRNVIEGKAPTTKGESAQQLLLPTIVA